MQLTEILKYFKDAIANPAKIVKGFEAVFPAIAKAKGYTVAFLNESEVYSEKFAKKRSDLFKTGRIVAVLLLGGQFYVLISPSSTRYERIWYLSKSLTAIQARLANGQASVITVTRSPADLIAELTEDKIFRFDIALSELKPKQRIDLRFYHPDNFALEKKLSGCKTLGELADVRGGLPTNFIRTHEAYREGKFIEHLRKSGVKLKYHEALFLGNENISPVGSIMGTPFAHHLEKRPRKPATRGEIIISLAGSKGNRGDASDTLGKVAIIENSGEFYVPQTFGIITPTSGVDSYFLLHQLNCRDVKRQLERLKKPANKFQMIVTKNDFKNVRIPEASDEEKEAIIKKQKQWITSLRKSIKEREESCKGESA